MAKKKTKWQDIKTFKDACKETKRDPKVLPDVSMLDKVFQKRIIADYKIMVFAEAINQGWKPDFTNSSQWKYFPYFYVKADKKKPSGFGFSLGLRSLVRVHACRLSPMQTIFNSADLANMAKNLEQNKGLWYFPNGSRRRPGQAK